MKRYVYTLTMCLFWLVASQANAKTIHWLTFFDTTDKNVGEIDKNTHSLLYNHWINMVNATVKENGYSVNVIDIYGNTTTPEKCKSVLNALKCEREDIVVFYYVGHGTENTRTSKYPLMLMAQHSAEKVIPLSWVHEQLKSKHARLTLTIGMCCNARQGILGRTSPSFAKNYGTTYLDESTAGAIRKMFLGYRGDLIVTSSSPGESSWALPGGETDYFTLALLMQFNNVLPEKSAPDWESMLQEMRAEIRKEVMHDMGKQQTAVWDNNLTRAQAPAPTDTRQPSVSKPTQTPQGSATPGKAPETETPETAFNNMLAYITSTNVSETKRMEVAQRMESLFASGAVVKMMSQDGNLVIDKEDSSTFLGRISTTSRVASVSVVDMECDSKGKITSLRVLEVCKKRK